MLCKTVVSCEKLYNDISLRLILVQNNRTTEQWIDERIRKWFRFPYPSKYHIKQVTQVIAVQNCSVMWKIIQWYFILVLILVQNNRAMNSWKYIALFYIFVVCKESTSSQYQYQTLDRICNGRMHTLQCCVYNKGWHAG